MSTSETDSEPELELTASTIFNLTAFASLSATPPSHGPAGQETVGWAVDTLTSLDFRLVRKDNTLHDLIQNCASTIVALFNTVLQQGSAVDSTCSFIPDIVTMLRPSFLLLLFQYRRLFHVIATRDFKPNRSSAPLAIVCWVDVILAKLGDVAVFMAAGLDGDHMDRSLPESLKGQKDEDNLRSAIQLPDNWDMLPSVLLSERMSPATKRLSLKLMFARYILYPALSGQASLDNIRALLAIFAEYIRQTEPRVDDSRLGLRRGPQYLILQERLSGAIAISLFAAADMARDATADPECSATFRPQTMSAVMRLLGFALNDNGLLWTNVLNPLGRLDAPGSVIIRWGIVPQWAWSMWLECRSLHADTIIYLTTAYITHQRAGPDLFSGSSDLMPVGSRPKSQGGMISVTIELVSRFNPILSASGHSRRLSAGMMNVLRESCQLISRWMNQNSNGIRNSRECCKVLIILFGHLSLNQEYSVVNDLVIECLSRVNEQCMREAWKAAVEDYKSLFLDALSQSFIQAKTAVSWDDVPKSMVIHVVQLMQFLAVMMFKGVQPLELEMFIEFVETVKERVLEIPADQRGIMCEALLTCLAAANISGINLMFGKADAVTEEVIWHLGMRGGGVNILLTAAFALYITSTPVSVEPLTHLEGLEHLVDTALLIYSRHYPCEDEPVALTVFPTICDALTHLLEQQNDAIDTRSWTNTRMMILLRILNNGLDGSDTLLKSRLIACTHGSTKQRTRAYELVFCRLDGLSHVLYVTDM